jgi:hypothetical protein
MIENFASMLEILIDVHLAFYKVEEVNSSGRNDVLIPLGGS